MKLALLVLLVVAGSAFADKVYVEDPGANVPSEIGSSTLKQLVTTSASSQGHQVVGAPGDGVATLRTSVLRLGSNYIVSIERWESGSLKNATKMKASRVEELDEIVARVVRAVMTGVEASKDARVDDVTEHEETKATRRKIARSGTTAAAGPAFLGKLNTVGPAFYFQVGQGYGMGPVSIGLRLDLAVDPDDQRGTALFGDVNLNLGYYFLDQDTSPFVQGEFGWGFVRDAASRDIFGGMVVGGTAGVAFMRTYSVHLEVGARFAAMIESAIHRTPILGAITLGIGF